MTCIVGLVDDGKVYIGGDSAGVAGLDYEIREDEKVFRKGKMVFGFTSSFRMGQILRYSFDIPDHDPRKNDFEYLCTTFVDALITCFKNKEYAKVDNGVVSGGFFLVGYKGSLYQVQSDFQVSRVKRPYDACGCGESYALGALHVMNKEKDKTPKDKVTFSLVTAEAFSAGVRSPFNIVSV